MNIWKLIRSSLGTVTYWVLFFLWSETVYLVLPGEAATVTVTIAFVLVWFSKKIIQAAYPATELRRINSELRATMRVRLLLRLDRLPYEGPAMVYTLSRPLSPKDSLVVYREKHFAIGVVYRVELRREELTGMSPGGDLTFNTKLERYVILRRLSGVVYCYRDETVHRNSKKRHLRCRMMSSSLTSLPDDFIDRVESALQTWSVQPRVRSN